MKYFMVHFNRISTTELNRESFKQEQLRFRDLMHEKLLLQVNINKTMTRLWLIFNVKGLETMHEIIKTLPVCSQLSSKIHELQWNQY